MVEDVGRSPSGPGQSAEPEPVPVSAVPATVPNAVTISGELYAFLMGEGPLEGVWFGELNRGLPGHFWWRGLLRCAAGWPASAGEARSDATPQSGAAEGEHAVAESETPNEDQDHD